MNQFDQEKKSIDEFYISAREYCRIVEQINEKSKIEFISDAQKILTLIYLKASLLSKSNDLIEENAEKFVYEEDWNRIKNSVSAILGASDNYIEVILPQNFDAQNIESELLSDCFADVYQDLKDFVSNYELGISEALIAALDDCIINYEQIWGPRLLAILVNLHCIINSDEIEEDDPDELNKNDQLEKSDKSKWLINQRFNQ
jgi:hypothetical protein